MAEGVEGVGGGRDGVVKDEVDDLMVDAGVDGMVVEEAGERRAAVKEEVKAETEDVGRVKEELTEGLMEEPELDEDAFSDDDLL